MPLFKFQIEDDLAIDKPVELDLPSADQAEREAVELLVELVRSRAGQLLRNGSASVTVRDGRDAVLLALTLTAQRTNQHAG